MRLWRDLITLLDAIFIKIPYEKYVFPRRNAVLKKHLSRVIPQNARVLDVGCGDGQLASSIAQNRQDIQIMGIDTLMRKRTFVPVEIFDGKKIPHDDGSFDAVLLIDVLHHTEDPLTLLKEVKRVTSRVVIIKDHMCIGLFAETTLRFMDFVGNARYDVALQYNYWTKQKWLAVFDSLDLTISEWVTDLGIYPLPADWIFGRSLQFIVRLDLTSAPA